MLLVISGAAIGDLQDRRPGADRRHLAFHLGTHHHYEYRRGFLRRRGDHRPRHRDLALLSAGLSWKWLYVIAGTICVLLIVTALLVKYPTTVKTVDEPINFQRTMGMMKNPYALGFSLGIFLYVATECAIYVWMPTLLDGYAGPLLVLAAYALSVFFVLRAVGRFLGAWVLKRFNGRPSWPFSVWRSFCFAGAVAGGLSYAIWLLPLSGLFMSMIYPTLNSKGISCFPKTEHGAVSGVILFFTCTAAALGPLAMGAVSDAFGHPRYGFVLATHFRGAAFCGAASELDI